MVRGKFWKRIVLTALLALCLSLTGCGKETGKENKTTETTPVPATPTGTDTPTQGVTPEVTKPVTPTPTEVVKKPRVSDEMVPGYVTNGFKVISREEPSGPDGAMIYLEHEKTGAQLIFVDCDDEELTFALGVRTANTDDTGVAHILEHSLMEGSEKYPDKSLMRKMLSQTYSAYMNAYTMTGVNYYPVASYSEEQLYALMDAYADCIFNPLFLKDEFIVWREGIHYELEDVNAPLSVSGIVYDEMLANQSGTAQMYLLLQNLFPESWRVKQAGGNPDIMMSVTYQDVVDFYNTYYHPSNMTLMLYGKFENVNRFTERLDSEYLSKYDRKEITIPESNDEPVSETGLTIEIKGENGSIATREAAYTIVLNDNSLETEIIAQILASTLNDPNSDLYLVMANQYPKCSFSVAKLTGAPLPTILFELIGATAEEAETFLEEIVLIAANLTKGILDENLVKSYLNKERYKQATIRENSDYGVTLFSEIMSGWSRYGTLSYEADYRAALDVIEKAAEDGTFENIIEEKLNNPKTTAFFYMNSDTTNAGNSGDDTAKKLEDRKKSMSSGEINDLVAKTKEYREWNLQDDAGDSVISKLQVIDCKDFSEDIPEAEIKDETKDDVRYLSSEIPNDEIFAIKLYLDANGVPYKSLFDIVTVANMLGKTGTENFTKEELQAFELSKLTNVTFGIENQHYADEDGHLYLVVTASGMKDQAEDTLRYIEEVLLTSDLTDRDAYLSALQKSRYQENYDYLYNSILVMQTIAIASEIPDYFLDYYMTYSMDYWSYMGSLPDSNENSIDLKLSNLGKIKSLLTHRPGAIVVTVGDAETVRLCSEGCGKILGKMNESAVKKQDYSNIYKRWKSHTAVILNGSTTQTNFDIISLANAGYEASGKLFVLQQIVSDILFEEVREKNGAYGAFAQISDEYSILFSYADPCLRETYEIFDSLGEMLRAEDITQEKLNGYILSCYGALMKQYQLGPFGTAIQSIELLLGHKSSDSIRKMLHDMKDMTPEDVKKLSAIYDRMKENGKVLSMVDVSVYNENADFFDDALR